MDDYERGGHTKYSMKVHLIFVTKYRRKIFAAGRMADDVKQSLYDAAKRYGYKTIRMETDKDHVHMLLGYSPKESVSDMARHLKQYSTHRMWMTHGPYLSKQYWKRRVLWSEGYFACSIGQVSQQIIERYIQNQG